MKKVLLVVGLVVLLFSLNANAKEFELNCGNLHAWNPNVSNSEEKFDFDFAYSINIETKEISTYFSEKKEKELRKKINNFKYSNNKLIFKYKFRTAEILTTIDFDDNSVLEEWVTSDGVAKVLGDCNNTQQLAKALESSFNAPSISTEDQNTVVAASSGTGFLVSTNGHMVTNNHVIDSCDTVKAHYKGRELDADVLFTDRSNDLAIIKANIKPEKVFPVSNDDVSLLEDIIVAGYPLGKNISASIKTFKGSVTALAGFGDNYSNFQIDASLSSGNSGGPIINQKGNVVGVAVEKLVEVGVEGFNFGVKSSTLKTFASSNQIKFQDPSTEELSNKELGQLITEATIYLECWMSVAKIKQIIQEGERQKAFFSEYK
jgi:S1-C subfamily serine protease